MGLAKASEDERLTQSSEDKLDIREGNHMRLELEKALYTAPLGMQSLKQTFPLAGRSSYADKRTRRVWTVNRAVILQCTTEADPSLWGWAGSRGVMSGSRKVRFVHWWTWGEFTWDAALTSGHLITRKTQMKQRRHVGGNPTSWLIDWRKQPLSPVQRWMAWLWNHSMRNLVTSYKHLRRGFQKAKR